MATVVEENNVEYDSDPEDAKRLLTMRRREASDDEEAEGEEVTDKREVGRIEVRSDNLDDEGGVEDYANDGDDVEEGEKELQEEEEEEEEVEEVYEEKGASGGVEVEGPVIVAKESDDDVRPPLEDFAEDHSEEKKESDPFAVPTAGAFYMHDDRFGDNAGTRNRRIHGGGRRLWESKDDKKWGHDKFEQILHEKHYEERRPSKGNYHGRGNGRGTDYRGYVRGSKKGYNSSSNQNQMPKSVVRGRGPQKYERSNKINGPSSQVQNKQSGKSRERNSNVSLERTSTPSSHAESDPVPSKNQVLASNLNSASPPYYPSGSSSNDINLAQKREVKTGGSSRNVGPVAVDEGFPVQQKNALIQGKNVVDSISMSKLYINESTPRSVGKPLNNVRMARPGSSVVNASQSPHPRASGTGRGVSIPVHTNFQRSSSHNKISPSEFQAIQTSSVPGRNSTSVQATAPQLGQRPGSGSPLSSPSKTATPINSHDSGELDSGSESGKGKGALVGKGRGASHGAGQGAFVYGGAQVIGTAGNVGVSHGDPNFPAFLPVMQFGGQHPGGIGVPAVGMAFPGYVAQPQLGKSEMTWLPVLAGTAGALGATYPYLAVDGASSHQSGQASAMGTSSKDHSVNKANNELKPPQKSELASEEFGQRQNKPRRYSEMNFGQ
ncbi:protein MLN51 homolog [Vigna umbellata]|uniref:protein MLN51 homolog n=1 Tax=Vigna umbellata TaxID=87088 RepID=UPI001F5F6170|nr:protein MLN51 homolog [Vigna umbellata]XP_047152406.1 protein MLN51 homolog [Vigna umbellata]